MDPDANLKEQINLARTILATEDAEQADRLAELVLALDEWINRGGALPERWNLEVRS